MYDDDNDEISVLKGYIEVVLILYIILAFITGHPILGFVGIFVLGCSS